MKKILGVIVCVVITITINYKEEIIKYFYDNFSKSYEKYDIPEYSGFSYVILNNNKTYFSEDDLTFEGEYYSDLDLLGRCGYAIAKVGTDTMPNSDRESIGNIKPTGWHTVRYDNIDGNYLYNRCHLIGFQLTGENANEKNLITCTRSMNTGVMLDYENMIADYMKNTGNHVLYRVTPIFEESNLLAKGVILEGKSLEDDTIEFNIFIFNVQDGIEIDYTNGQSKRIG